MAKQKVVEQMESEVFLDAKGKRVVIRGLEIQDPELYEALQDQRVGSRVDFVKRALKVGAIALRDIAVMEKIDYVKREFEKLCNELDTILLRELGEEGVQGELDSIFGKNGRLQQCLDNVFGSNGKLARDILDIDNKKSPIGQLRETIESYFVGKDSQMYGMLDPHTKDSPMCRLREDIMSELQQLRTKIEEEVTRRKVIEKSPEKGFIFEDQLENFLASISRPFGDTVERVSTEKGKLGNLKGDFVVILNDPTIEGEPPKIVVEAKAGEKYSLTQKGLRGELDEAIQNREARFAIAVTKSIISEAVGCYREIERNKLICTFGENGLPLEVAYKIARTCILLEMRKEIVKEVDIEKISSIIAKISNDLGTIRGIKAKLTSIDKTTKKIVDDIETLEKTVRESLSKMQEALLNASQSHSQS